MQTQQNQAALSPTATEIRAIIHSIWREVENAIKAGTWPAGHEPVYSFDNARIHEAAQTGWYDPHGWRVSAGIKGVVKFVPPYSPDLHQVIEHAHGSMERNYKKYVQEYVEHKRVQPQEMPGFIDAVRECFVEGNPLSSIQKGVAKMEKVYDYVIEHGGGKVCKELS